MNDIIAPGIKQSKSDLFTISFTFLKSLLACAIVSDGSMALSIAILMKLVVKIIGIA